MKLEARFAPIAIVGRACVLPGALSPEALWELVVEGGDAIVPAPEGSWGLARDRVIGSTTDASGDRAWTDRGGYVRAFESIFDPRGFGIHEREVRALDPLVQWTLHTAREALRDAGRLDAGGRAEGDAARTGAILGNLSFPSEAMSRYAAHVWLENTSFAPSGPPPDPRSRFMSGLPVHELARALGVAGPRFALDAACASSLYAVALACDALHEGRADTMLAGAVNRADDLFIRIGFCALHAMSKTGRSRPFHADADGLVPGEGAAIVVLRRLEDALREGERILGVIRGVGLANDGRGRGLLAPHEDGQIRAMRAAWDQAGLDPRSADYVECHATGTPVGDATELRSMSRAFEGVRDLPIGSLKANLGHLVTVAGAAGLIKVLSAMEHGQKPATPHLDRTTPALEGTPFRVLRATEPWSEGSEPRRAGLSAFGFGGSDAHLVVEELRGQRVELVNTRNYKTIAVVAIGARVGSGADRAELARDLAFARTRVEGGEARAREVVIALEGLRSPPRDLEQAIAQQTMLLAAARECAAQVPAVSSERVAVIAGMGCDPEVARWGARWRLAAHADAQGWSREQLRAAQADIAPPLEAAIVVGTMPNIVANRINAQLDAGGPGFTVSAEEASGIRALEIACRMLARGEVDLAYAAASDASAEPVHARASAALLGASSPGDAAIVLALMREDDARREGASILAIIDDGLVAGEPTLRLGDEAGALRLDPLFGRSHAAWGLVHVAAGALAIHHGFRPQTAPRPAQEAWVDRRVEVTVEVLGAEPARVRLRAAEGVAPAPITSVTLPAGPLLRLAAHPPVPRAPQITNTMQNMDPAPALPPVMKPVNGALHERAEAMRVAPATPAAPAAVHARATSSVTSGLAAVLATAAEHQRRVGDLHRELLARQSELHQQFLRTREHALLALLQGPTSMPALPAALTVAAAPLPALAPAPAPAPAQAPPAPAPSVSAPRALGQKPRALVPDPARAPIGPRWDRSALEIHAGGRISTIFGPLFEQQDEHLVQVRMPMEPMLLADRVSGIDAEPGKLGKGTVWTETDVTWESWYLHEGRMPAGILIEAGQADLFLISYMGADFLNRGKRAYRLLGCELTYHRSPPRPGETIRYDIHVDGHASQGDVRLFFFHYDCRIVGPDGAAGEPVLTVRHGQAGFFTREELDDSAGILWTAETQEIVAGARVDAPVLPLARSAFAREHLDAFAMGHLSACFGAAFEPARAHVRTPRIAGGRMLFFERVDTLEPAGGPWKRGYLRATRTVTPDDWFFGGHFHNDPCMPGTLMFEGCLQAMSFYLAGLGVTVARDGWRFEPIPGETYSMLCRGQVTPESKELVYEVFVEELHDGPVPTIYADLLCTVDGLAAFHTRRMGLRLVPDWPISSHPLLVRGDAMPPAPSVVPSVEVARAPNGPSAGFAFDYASLLACAWGRPSAAFGPIYERFDGHRKVARLPGPPYHFMSRVVHVAGAMGEPKAGAEVTVDYDVPRDAWYFRENGAPTMPMCVLMEAALQPCGWLASYVGCALTNDVDLLFRNLDGKGTVHAEVLPSSGTLRTHAKLKSFSKSGAMIIVAFDVRCTLPSRGDALVYSLDTVFGFFPKEAFEDQPGLPISDAQRALYASGGATLIDLRARPVALCSGSARVPTAFVLMLDRVVHFDPKGGAKGKGALRAEKDVDPSEWFFKAHFFQDPVQPGSLGVEAMCQLLQVFMLETGMHEGIEDPRFEPIATEVPLVWKYRGQVVPANRVIACTMEITAVARDERGAIATADASLWVDGKRIYDARGLAMRIVSGAIEEPRELVVEETIDPEGWVRDHRPTWVIPALPAMSMLDRMADAAARASGEDVVAIEAMQIQRWITLPEGPVKIRTSVTPGAEGALDATLEVWREARDSKLSRFEPAATARVRTGTFEPGPPPLAPLADARLAGSPYSSGRLFHGPTFQRQRELRMGAAGSSARIDAAVPEGAPAGRVHPILLDAATHGVPHDAMESWCEAIPPGRAAYPYRIERATFHAPAPRGGEVRCEARFAGFDQHVRVRLQLVQDERVWCELELVEVLLPKGPIGAADPLARQAFLRDGVFVPGVGLSSELDSDTTRLELRDVAASNWLPGTVERVYAAPPGRDLALEVAIRDHVARASETHPSRIAIAADLRSATSAHEPLNRHFVSIERDEPGITVRTSGKSALELEPVRSFWRSALGAGAWPGEDLTLALVERFVRRVHLSDPDAIAALSGRSVLFLANHQVGIESLLFGIIASALNGLTTLTLAKKEHAESWLGRLIQHLFSYPGIIDPHVIAYFDRSEPASLPRILGELGAMMKGGGKNVTIHVEGTRARRAGEPVTTMSGVFCDMAITLGAPIVPVRFVGGLPREEVPERLELPYAMGRQDYHLGAPIEPSELASMPYKARTERVLAAIEALGPGRAREAPFDADPALERAAHEWSERTGATPPHAAIFRVLEATPKLGPELAALVRGAREGRLTLGASAHDAFWSRGGPREAWLTELATRLFGPRGP